MKTRVDRCRIAVDGERLTGTLLTPATYIPGVLFVHGWGGSQAQDLSRARAAAGLGCVSLTFDLRGAGGDAARGETVTREQNLRDLLAAYDFLAAMRGVDPAAIAVVGTSYGAYLATLLAAEREVRWLALHAPAIYPDDHWDHPKRSLNADPRLMEYRRSPIAPGDNRALRACAAFRGDVLLVESEHDDTVPRQLVANYKAAFGRAQSLTARLIKGADHALSSDEAQSAYGTLLTGWITEMVVGARATLTPGASGAHAEHGLEAPGLGQDVDDGAHRQQRP